jgi:predicted P-type ATPase
MLGWCAFNQRLSPVPGSIQPLLAEEKSTEFVEESASSWKQTGYRAFGRPAAVIGALIYLIVVVTLVGFQFILGSLTIFYYIQQGAITWFEPVFEDEIQVLKVHEITWAVAFVFTLLLKWPVSVRFLFLRRSMLEDASHVAVQTPVNKVRQADQGTALLDKINNWMIVVGGWFKSAMRCMFSDISLPASGAFETTVCPVIIDKDGTRYFFFRLRRYNFDNGSSVFLPGACSTGNTISDLIKGRGGLNSDQVEKEMALVGPNVIQMSKPNILNTLVREFSKGFYVYQVFMIWTWFPLWYYYMACVQTFIVSGGGLAMTVFQYRNERNLYRITRITGDVSVMRDGSLVRIDHRDLVPGDVVAVTSGLVYADMVVVDSPGHILVDESALTGESTPMAKIPFDVTDGSLKYNYADHKKHAISAGTSIIEAEVDTYALILSTGSHTAKGKLLRDILSYRRQEFKFDTEVKIVIAILFLYCIFGFGLTVGLYKDDFVFEWFYGMFVVGTCLVSTTRIHSQKKHEASIANIFMQPPLLPTVFTVSVGISDERLANKRIMCVNSEDILVAGKVKRVFFDKTGTLTKQGLDFIIASACLEDKYLDLAMAACHSITVSSKGVLIGNAVDLNMFAETRAVISEQGRCIELGGGDKVKVLKKFDFDHHRMTQSVIVEADEKLFAFVKGSGESIKKICVTKTIPADFDRDADRCAREGIYQISFAMKELSSSAQDVSNLARDSIEDGLNFLGFVNFKNQLRTETADVLTELEVGDVKSVMVTGDNTFTGICIAREANMIKLDETVMFGKSIKSNGVISWVDEQGHGTELPSIIDLEKKNIVLAVTGDVWNSLQTRSDIIEMAEFVRVFGRCTPNDKVSVIDFFVKKGLTCCMVGDGGNDCGALKAAHIGIALSDAEASIVAPFTSLDKDITSVLEVLKEGRCALASAFASYKYMIMYGQIETINQIANAYFSVTFHEWCWVFMDGIWMITMAFTLPLARAEKHLSPKRPTSSLLGPGTMASVLGVLLLNFTFTCISLGLLTSQDWYQCRKWGSTDISNITLIGDNYEASVLFIVTGYQYISSAIAFNFGYTFRSSWWKNYVFVILTLCFTIVHLVATLEPSKLSCVWRLNCTNDNVVRAVTDVAIPINNAFNTTIMPLSFRVKLVVLMIFNTIATSSWEFFIVNGTFVKKYLWDRRNG